MHQSFQAIEKRLQLNNTRLGEMERIMTTQDNVIKELASKQKTVHIKPLPITPIRLPTTPVTHTTPRISQPLPDLPLTPTSYISDSHLPQTFMQRLVLSMYLGHAPAYVSNRR